MDIRRFLDPSGTLVWTMTTNGYKYYTLNLAQSLRNSGIPWKLCVVCVDRESQAFLRVQGVDCVLYGEQIPRGQMDMSSWHSDTFHMITRFKLSIMDELLGHPDVKCLAYLDGDIVVKQDFIPYMWSTLKEGVWTFQCDEGNEEPCSAITDCPNFCTGCIFFRKGATDISNPFMVDMKLWNTCKGNHDQEYVQKRIRELGLPFQTLDRYLFPNGKMIKHAPTPYLRHYNYRVGSSKKTGMRGRGDWYIPY
jgi:hypothetical protein